MEKLKVNLEEIGADIESQDREILDFYLDTETGECIPIPTEIIMAVDNGEPMDNLLDWEEPLVDMAREVLFGDSKRYINIPVIPSYEGYDLMVEFAERIEDEVLREKLTIALDGHGAFRRFKNVLSMYPEIQQEWYKFKDERLNKKVIEWLNSVGIEPLV